MSDREKKTLIDRLVDAVKDLFTPAPVQVPVRIGPRPPRR
jgi:hypothetical protein